MSKDIKIFVSHRIDLDSMTIDNPIYIPVYCGAIYKKDKRNPIIMGDDTGVNISDKREKFNEFTVMYWAWKNQQADYYGLCHYRRYLSFSNKKYPVSMENNQHVVEENICEKSVKKYNLLREDYIREEIEKYDAVIIDPIDITKVMTPKGLKSNVKNHWLGWEDELIKKNTIDELLICIKKIAPQYLEMVNDYLSNSMYYGFNCFILKKNFFNELCEFVFPVLFELDSRLDYTYFSENQCRVVGYMGEILVGAYLFNLTKEKIVKNTQLIYIEDTELKKNEITKTKAGNSIPVVLVCSDFYVPYLSVFLESLIDRSSGENYYDIIIFEKDISRINKKTINNIVENKKNFSIRFFNAKKIFEDYSLYVASPTYAEEAYYRMITPWVLKDYDKAIVMDCDIIMQDDIANLYYIDVDGYLVAGVKDVIYQGMLNWNQNNDYEYCKKDMQMNNPYNYINTGVLVMNLQLFRDSINLNELLKFSSEHKFRIQEQDILNIYVEGKVKFINCVWNYYVELNSWVTKCLNSAPVNARKEYLKSDRDKKIVHYASLPKPWDDPSVPHADKFWRYAQKSPYMGVLIRRMIDGKSQDEINLRNMLLDPNFSFRIGENLYGRFKFPWEIIPAGAKIVLYGGGIVGKTFMEQIANSSYCQLVGICDKNPKGTGIVESPVMSIKQLLSLRSSDYDLILIAIEKKNIAVEIRKELELAGIPAEKIKYVNPSVNAR